MTKPTTILIAIVFCCAWLSQTFAQDKPVAADAIAQSDLVGSQVLETPYGVMTIDNDYPTDETIAKLFEQRDRQRATEVYLWPLPIVQFQIWSEQQAKTFGSTGTDVVVLTSFNEKGGIITGNATTPYLISFFNLAETGPLVIDFPSGPYAGAYGQNTQPSIKYCRKSTFKRFRTPHLSRTDMHVDVGNVPTIVLTGTKASLRSLSRLPTQVYISFRTNEPLGFSEPPRRR